MNSKSLLTTVFRNFQCCRKKRGYCPTTYMMLLAMMALLSLPLFCSHKPNKSCWKKNDLSLFALDPVTFTLMTVTKKRFSSSSCMAPEMDPMAQHSVFRFFQLHSVPFT